MLINLHKCAGCECITMMKKDKEKKREKKGEKEGGNQVLVEKINRLINSSWMQWNVKQSNKQTIMKRCANQFCGRRCMLQEDV